MSTRNSVKKSVLFFFCVMVFSLSLAAQSTRQFVTVDAARYQPAVSPDSIVAGFAPNLTATEAWPNGDLDPVTPGIQLPTTLNGLRVLVNNRPAELLYVGPSQINYVVPAATEVDAPATVVVTDTQGTVLAQGTLAMAASNFSLFTFNQVGTGSPAALVTADGNNYAPVTNADGSTNVVTPGQYLVLFGTGIRAGQDVKAFIGGVEATVEYAGTQNWFVGLDQINLRVPAALQGQGQVEVVITDGSTTSNTVVIDVGGNPSVAAAAPVITGFNTNEAAAGQVVTITGSNFPTTLSEAGVRIGGANGQVVATSANALSFVVPYGAASGKVTVSNLAGERQSTASLTITTSISGTVVNFSDEPVAGVPVSIVGTGLSTVTDALGRFLLLNVPRGAVQLYVDASVLPANLGLSDMSTSLVVSDGRDNELGHHIYLPTITEGSTYLYGTTRTTTQENANTPVVLENNGVRLEIPGAIQFPGGRTNGKVALVRLPVEGRLPSILPAGIFPTVAALITPLGTTFGTNNTELASLSFPNPDALPAGATLDLYAFRYNVAPAGFVKKGQATVSTDGTRILATGLIDFATVWFVALPAENAPLTTVTGTVVDSTDRPVNKARVWVRGRTATTDKDGKFEIKGIRAKDGEMLQVEALFVTPTGTPLKTRTQVSAVVPGITNAGTLQFPAAPPLALLLRPTEVKLNLNGATDLKLTLSRTFAAPVKINLTSAGDIPLEITPGTLTLEAGKNEVSFSVKGTTAGKGKVVATLAEPVETATPENTQKGVAAIYVLAAPPVLQTINPVSGAPGSMFTLTGTGFHPEANRNGVFFQQGDRIIAVDPKTLSTTAAGTTQKEAAAMILSGIVPGLKAGVAEVFVRNFQDGIASAPSNALKFTITVPAAPQLETITPNQGLPGASFTLTATGLDATARNNAIFFKLGDKIYGVNPESLKVTAPTSTEGTAFTVQGIVPRMPAGDVEIFAVVFRNGAPSEKSNSLRFKVLAPAGAVLASVDPAEGLAGASFTIKGSGFDPEPSRNFLFFKQGDRVIQLPATTVRTDGKTYISAVVPKLTAGTYSIFVLTNLDSVLSVNGGLPGTISNELSFKILAPPAANITAIDPVQGQPGIRFTLQGSGFDPEPWRNRIVFKQGERFVTVDPLTIKGSATALSGVVPELTAGDYEIVVLTNLVAGTITGSTSNSIKFTVVPPPALTLKASTPAELVPGQSFKLLGEQLSTISMIFFVQNQKTTMIPNGFFKLAADGSVESIVPGLRAGEAQVFVGAGTAANPVFSNRLTVKIAAGSQIQLTNISSVTGSPEGYAGDKFKITGSNLTPIYTVVFKQGDKVFTLAPFTYQVVEGVLVGTLPNVPVGNSEVYLTLGFTDLVVSNPLSFTFKART